MYLSFNGSVYTNNSAIQIAKLVEISLDQGVQCITDRKPCCRNDGEWLFPNGTSVPTQHGALSFYKSSGNNGNVTLNLLRNNELLPLLTGTFCCAVPDAKNVTNAACIEISELAYRGVAAIHYTITIILLLLSRVNHCC